jgi:hypothetical protein
MLQDAPSRWFLCALLSVTACGPGPSVSDAAGSDAAPRDDASSDAGAQADSGLDASDAALPPVTVSLTNLAHDATNDFAFVAVQAGGPEEEWLPVAGVGGVYEAQVPPGRYSLAWVCEAHGGRIVFLHATTDEGTTVRQPCRPSPQRSTVSGSLASVPGAVAYVVADGVRPASGADAYSVEAERGEQDFIVLGTSDTSRSMIVTRAVSVSGPTTLDFDFAASAFELEEAPLTIVNGGGTRNVFTRFVTAGGNDELAVVGDATSFLAIPAAERAADDLHVVWAEQGGGSAWTTLRATADVTLTIPDPWSGEAETTIVIADPFDRPTTSFGEQPADLYRLWYGDGASASGFPFFAYVTPGWLGAGPVYVYELPDPSAVSGWDARWAERDATYALAWSITAIAGDAGPLEHVCEDDAGIEDFGASIDTHRACGEALLDDVGRTHYLTRSGGVFDVTP